MEFQKPSNQEEEYFAREELELKRKLARQQRDALAEQEKERLKALHFMKCPRCGMDLHLVHHGDLDLETCFNCRGVWLDAGELDRIAKKPTESVVMGAILNWFSHE